MYSTNIENSRYPIKCIAFLGRIRIVKFIVDTGAIFTCCNYVSFDKNLREEDFVGFEIKFLGGLVKDLPVKFYRCRLKQFTIGNIDMGEQDIWITFDKRVTDTVLGMDILKQVIFTANPYDNKMHFCKDRDDYRKNLVPLIV